MMVIYLPVKFEFDWTNRFQVRVRNERKESARERALCQRTDCF